MSLLEGGRLPPQEETLDEIELLARRRPTLLQEAEATGNFDRVAGMQARRREIAELYSEPD